MDLLLDTNALLWTLAGDERIGQTVSLIGDRRNRVFVSAASAWEIAIKVGLGKLKVPPHLETWFPAELAGAQLTPLPIAIEHVLEVENLPRHHADPFDRLLIAQARRENLTLITADQQFEHYDVRVIRC